jgi:hypothetical protein
VINLKDVNKLILINAFKNIKILGAKALDYADFYKAVKIINRKAFLTRVGLEIMRV